MSEFDRVMESWEAMSLPGVSVVRSYIAELEAELVAYRIDNEDEHTKRLAAEAELAQMTTYRDNARQHMEWLRDERDTARAALAERDKQIQKMDGWRGMWMDERTQKEWAEAELTKMKSHKVFVELATTKAMLRLAVIDGGIGMDSDYLADLRTRADE